MNTSAFKSNLKEISSQLRGITLQLISGMNTTPYKTLREFGYAVLAAENAGQEIQIKKVWLEKGSVEVSTFAQLAEILATGKVTGVQFLSCYIPKNFTDYLVNCFGTTE